jgi:hypothetical protein
MSTSLSRSGPKTTRPAGERWVEKVGIFAQSDQQRPGPRSGSTDEPLARPRAGSSANSFQLGIVDRAVLNPKDAGSARHGTNKFAAGTALSPHATTALPGGGLARPGSAARKQRACIPQNDHGSGRPLGPSSACRHAAGRVRGHAAAAARDAAPAPGPTPTNTPARPLPNRCYGEDISLLARGSGWSIPNAAAKPCISLSSAPVRTLGATEGR